MNLDAAQMLFQFVNGRRAFVELAVGPLIREQINLDDHTCVFPIAPIGNNENIRFGAELLSALKIPADQGFYNEANRQGATFSATAAFVYLELSDEDFELASLAALPKVMRHRALLALYAGGPFTPVMRIQWVSPGLAHVEFLPPRFRRGLSARYPDDPISPDFVRACATRSDDDQLHYFLILLEQASELGDDLFRIARLYSVLETMASSITSQFERQAGRPMKRTAIRFMTGYFSEFDISRFTVGDAHEFEFDHIELAGQVRDKIFHGGGLLRREDVPVKLRHGLDLLHLRPDLLCHALRRDCEREIVGWAQKESRAWQAQCGKEFAIPERNPNYDGRTLAKQLISSPAPPGSSIGSVTIKVNGEAIGIVKLHIIEDG
jgi:hypothetical protein